MADTWRGERLTRRQYLLRRVLVEGADIWSAQEAVASTLLAHPEWDAEEIRTWEEWDEVNAR